jgi:hypothetical protein
MTSPRKKPYSDRTVCVGSGTRSPGIGWCPFCEQFIYTRNDGNLMKHFAQQERPL